MGLETGVSDPKVPDLLMIQAATLVIEIQIKFVKITEKDINGTLIF